MTRDAEIRAAVLALAKARGAGKTICPSEVARHIGGQDQEVWRPLMGPVRTQTIALAKLGSVLMKQGVEIIDPDSVTGIYRIGIPDV